MSATWAIQNGRFETEPATTWTDGLPLDMGQVRGFDLSPDGRLAAITEAPGQKDHRLMLALNFFDEVRRRIGN